MFAKPTKQHIQGLASAGVNRIHKAAILLRRCAPLLLLLAVSSYSVAPVEPPHPPADALDKTDCNCVVLDDSAFLEPLVRDHGDESYGALANSAVRPLGGGEGYRNIVPVSRPPVATLSAGAVVRPPGVVVRTADELRAALVAAARTPQTVYVDDNAEIDLSYCAKKPTPLGCSDPGAGPEDDCLDFSLQIPPNTTLASGRGRIGSLGARLFSRTFTQCPMLEVRGPGVRITGLRVHGPDSSIENDDSRHCEKDASAIGVRTRGAPLRLATEIDNNELSAWPFSPVVITLSMGVRVHHNVIQFNRRQEHNGTCAKSYGLGYGVEVRSGSATIEANVFDHNRHDIASTGESGASYTATYNLVLTGAVDHSFDVHGGVDRATPKGKGECIPPACKNPCIAFLCPMPCGKGDCTNVAGRSFVIHHNTFLASSEPAVTIRGIPTLGMWVYKNEVHHSALDFPFRQINSNGNFFVSDNKAKVNKFPAWFISFGGSSFWQWRRFESQGMSGVAAGDFDGDGAADVMRSTPTGWQWSSERGGWAFLNTNKEPVSQLAFGDFVGSALTDIVCATGTEWQVSDGGTSQWRTLLKTGAPLLSVAFADFGGDGKTDALFADGIEWTIVESYSPEVRSHIKQPFKVNELRFGNFAGDAKVDVLRSTGSEWLVWDRNSKTWNHLNTSSVPLANLTFADFNGDGFTDIARNDDGKWLVSWGGKSRWQVLNTSDLDLKSQLIADFNGDRKADVLSRQSPAP